MSDLLTYTSWLYTKIYQNEFFFFDLWSLVHFWNGFMLFFLISSTKTKNPFRTILIILFLYEILEILLAYFVLGIFKPETFKDQFTDMFVGLSGSFTGYLLLSNFSLTNPRIAKQLNLIIMILSSLTYGFLWVGFYGYTYNISFFNSPGINWYAWSLWFLASFSIIYAFEYIPVRNRLLRLFIIWASFMTILFILEALGYYWVNLREISNPKATPLVFGIIHGTPVMHFNYIFSPLLIIGLFYFLKHIIQKPFRRREKLSFSFSFRPYDLIHVIRNRSLTNK